MNLPLWILLLAEGEDGDPSPATSQGMDPSSMFFMFGGVLLIFYLIAWRPQARERKQREAMLGAMKKGDKVMTSSGIYGTVVALSERDVTLKVDDKNNVRMRFSRSAIQNVITDEKPAEDPKKS